MRVGVTSELGAGGGLDVTHVPRPRVGSERLEM